eukprot:COSAG01_NODE_32969_length_572_cov_1.186047_1_plen_134_part_01
MPAYEGVYEGSDEVQAREWIEDALDDPLDDDEDVPLGEVLKSGATICQLLNRIAPGTVKKISQSKMPFPQRENVQAFIQGARSLGVPEHENFETSDLFEQSNMRQVLICLRSLGRLVYTIESYDGPAWGKPDKS